MGHKWARNLCAASSGSDFNYFKHVLYSVHKALKEEYESRIKRPSSADYSIVHEITTEFPLLFFDGTKLRHWRPLNEYEQKWKY